MASRMNGLLLASVGLLAAEYFFFRSLFPHLYSPSSHLPIDRAYALVLLVNGVISSWVLTILGFQVGRARTRAKEEAKKEGDDPDYEESMYYALKLFMLLNSNPNPLPRVLGP